MRRKLQANGKKRNLQAHGTNHTHGNLVLRQNLLVTKQEKAKNSRMKRKLQVPPPEFHAKQNSSVPECTQKFAHTEPHVIRKDRTVAENATKSTMRSKRMQALKLIQHQSTTAAPGKESTQEAVAQAP
jgi:hypothetical protein